MKTLDTQGRQILTAGSLSLLPVPNASPLEISGTWSGGANPTGIKLNITDSGAGATALLADLTVGGGSKWRCDKAGKVTQAGILQLGFDGGSPSAQTVKAMDAVGTNLQGADLVVTGGLGTGTGKGGSLLFKTAAAGQAVQTRMEVDDTSVRFPRGIRLLAQDETIQSGNPPVVSNIDYAPVIYFRSSTAQLTDCDVTGVVAPPADSYCPLLILINHSNFLVFVKGENTGSSADNRFLTDVELQGEQTAMFVYSQFIRRWMLLSKA